MIIILSLTAGSDCDYTSVSMTVTIAPGQAMASVSVPIRDDNTVEFTEMFNATLTTTESIVNVGDDTGTVSIVDNDGELLPSVLAHGSME